MTTKKPRAKAGIENAGKAALRNVRLTSARLDELIEEATVDAHDESEQRMGFFTMFENDLTVPFDAVVLGVKVTVEQIDLNEAEEIVAICRHGDRRQAISIVDLQLSSPPSAGAEWIEAYRRWAGRR